MAARKLLKTAATAILGWLALCAGAQKPQLSDIGPAPLPQSSVLAGAQQMLDAGNFRDAQSLLRDYLRQNDLSGQAHEMLAYALLRENQPKESLGEYTRAASLEIPSAEMLIRVGQDYVLLNDDADADKWTLRAVEMNPRDAEAWYSLGRIRYTLQHFSDAAACFERVLVLSPKNVKAENNLGLAYDAMNHPAKAEAAYRQAIAWEQGQPLDEQSEQPMLNLATTLVQRNALAEAEPLLTEGEKLAPQDPHVHEQLGHLYLQQSNYAAARKEFALACQLDPGTGSLHFLLGQAAQHLGLKQEAEAQFAIAARLSLQSARSAQAGREASAKGSN